MWLISPPACKEKPSAGEILIDEESYGKHAADFPDARPEQVVLKGFREPVTAYRLHGDRHQAAAE